MHAEAARLPNAALAFYDRAFPFLGMLLSLLLAGNFYYLRFSCMLYRCIKRGDGAGAGNSFGMVFTSGVIFLVSPGISCAILIWRVFATVRRQGG